MAFQSPQALSRLSRLLAISNMSATSFISLPSSAEEVSKRAKKASMRAAAEMAELRYEEICARKVESFAASLRRRFEARSVTAACRSRRACSWGVRGAAGCAGEDGRGDVPFGGGRLGARESSEGNGVW